MSIMSNDDVGMIGGAWHVFQEKQHGKAKIIDPKQMRPIENLFSFGSFSLFLLD